MTTGQRNRRGRKFRAFLQKHWDDLLVCAGWGMIVYGVALLNLAAAWIVGGVLLMGITVLMALGGKR